MLHKSVSRRSRRFTQRSSAKIKAAEADLIYAFKKEPVRKRRHRTVIVEIRVVLTVQVATGRAKSHRRILRKSARSAGNNSSGNNSSPEKNSPPNPSPLIFVFLLAPCPRPHFMSKSAPEKKLLDLTGHEFIEVIGAREHNLKNISVNLPRNQLVVITGISGSGKSSLAFDTIYAEGQRRYMESFSAYARSFIGNLERPDVDKINGLSPVISIEQKTTSRNPRSTVGTVTEIYDFMRLLFARAGEAFSYLTGDKMVRQSEDQILDTIINNYSGKKLTLLAPVLQGREGHYRELFVQIRKQGFTKVRVDGAIQEIV